MAWMTRIRGTHTTLLLLCLAMFAQGCGPDAKQQRIDELTSENEQLRNDLEDKDRALNDAMVRENDARDTIDSLNQQMAKLRSQQPTEGQWATFSNFDMLSIQGSVLFDSGKADLTAQGRARLAQVASEIRSRFADRDIYIFGHTDDQPIRKSKWKDNWELGANRSLTVIRALRDMGVPNDTLVQANCGEHRPKVANSSEKSRQVNRRVEFYAVRRAGAGGIDTARTAAGSIEE